MLGDALSFPRSGDDWIPTLLIGGILSVLGVLVIPLFILQGYLVRVLRAAANDDHVAPSFTDWGELLVDGLKLFVINLAYGILFMIPYITLIFVVGFGSDGGPGLIGLVLGVIVFVLAVVIGFFIPAALANFAIEDSLGAAFDFGTIKAGAFTGDYVMAWVLAIVIGFAGGLIGAALSIILVGIFVLFYVQVVTYYLFGRGFAKGLGRTGGSPSVATTSA